MTKAGILALLFAAAFSSGGCSQADPTHRIVFLDGAGHLGAGGSVQRGLRKAGFEGEFDVFHWQSGLLWGVDHLVTARSTQRAQELADELTLQRRRHPNGYLGIMGLSAGSAVVVAALELLPEDVQVNSVVLFQPSISATRNLAPAMRHVRGKLYCTCSSSDAILGALLTTADGGPLPPAGKIGFRVPLGLPAGQRTPYSRVVNLPWRSKYNSMGWGGGHVTSTSSSFVHHVIGPRMLEPVEAEPTRPAAIAAMQD